MRLIEGMRGDAREKETLGRARVHSDSLVAFAFAAKFRPSFLEKRRLRLQEWLRIVLLHPVSL